MAPSHHPKKGLIHMWPANRFINPTRAHDRLCELSGQKSGRTQVPRISRIFVSNFLPNFAPKFPRNFRGVFVLRFPGNGDQKKFTKNPRPFSMQNSQANTKKIFTKFFWRAGKVMNSAFLAWENRQIHDGLWARRGFLNLCVGHMRIDLFSG